MTPTHARTDRRSLRRSRRGGGIFTMTVLAIAAITLTAGSTLAQDGGGRRGGPGGRGGMRGGPMGQLFQPEILRRDMAMIDRELDLDEGQTNIVETLFLDYDTAFTEAAEAVRDRFAELRPERPEGWEQQRDERRKMFGAMRDIRREMRTLREQSENGEIDPEAMAKLQERMEPLRDRLRELRPPMPEGDELERMRESMATLVKQWRAERAVIRGEFMDNLQAVMGDEQLEAWPAFERALRREKTLRNGQLSGERQDLFLVLREAGYPDKDLWRIQDALDGYATALDAALKSRNSFLDEEQMEIFGAMMAGETERAAKLMEREAELRVAVRDVNERYVETIAARIDEELPGPMSGAFRTGFQQRAYARVFRPTAVQRAFQVARSLDGLDDDAIVAVMTLEESYLTELAEMNRQLVQLTRQHEPERNARRLERRMSWMRRQREPGGFDPQREREPDPIQEGFDHRRELDDRYRTMLESNLTPEQVAELPEPDRRGGPGRGGWDRGGWGRNGDGIRGRRNGDGAQGDRRRRRGDTADGEGRGRRGVGGDGA